MSDTRTEELLKMISLHINSVVTELEMANSLKVAQLVLEIKANIYQPDPQSEELLQTLLQILLDRNLIKTQSGV